MKKAIIIGTLLIFSGGVYVAAQPNDVIPPQAMVNLDFSSVDIGLTLDNARFSTETDEQGNETRTAIMLPVRYNFPVATTTGFIIEEVVGNVEVSLYGYSVCRHSGKTKEVCVQGLDYEIEQHIDAFKRDKVRELDELKRKSSQYQDEIVL